MWDTLYVRDFAPRNTPGLWRIDVYAETEFVLFQTFEIVEVTAPEPTPSTSPGGRSGCFIATAAFGSPLVQEVAYMRYVRDDLIGSSVTGAVLNNFYYSWSPPIANIIAESDALKALFKGLLAR